MVRPSIIARNLTIIIGFEPFQLLSEIKIDYVEDYKMDETTFYIKKDNNLLKFERKYIRYIDICA